MKVSAHTVGALQENCYLVVDEERNRAVLIDPGAEGERLIAAMEASGAALEAIWVTHAHIDHLGGIAAVVRRWDVPVYLHSDDERLYRAADRQAAAYGLPFEPPPARFTPLSDGGELRVGATAFRVMHTPGHSPGHCVFHTDDLVFAGDLLFAGSIGRTDLPLSDPARMQDSLARVATLPERASVYPGHGPATSIGAELRSNPFLSGVARVPQRR